MKSLLNQLDDESMLLMYLADELPPQDRSHVESRLDGDDAFKAQFETLRDADGAMTIAFEKADGRRVSSMQGAATRRVMRALQVWQADRLRERAAVPPARQFHMHFPVWTYPVAAAAAIVLGFVFWGMNVKPSHGPFGGNDSTAWNGDVNYPSDSGVNDSFPIIDQYAKLEETLDDSATLTVVDDQVNSLSDWGAPIFPRDVVDQ